METWVTFFINTDLMNQTTMGKGKCFPNFIASLVLAAIVLLSEWLDSYFWSHKTTPVGVKKNTQWCANGEKKGIDHYQSFLHHL